MGVSDSEDSAAGGVSDSAGVGGVIREGRGISGRREGEGGEGEGEGEGGRGEEELAARGLGGVNSEPFMSESLRPPPSPTWLLHFEENDDKCFHHVRPSVQRVQHGSVDYMQKKPASQHRQTFREKSLEIQHGCQSTLFT